MLSPLEVFETLVIEAIKAGIVKEFNGRKLGDGNEGWFGFELGELRMASTREGKLVSDIGEFKVAR